jgi:hypothetical protein
VQEVRAYSKKGNDNAVTTERIASKIHKPQAKFLVHSPHSGTQTKQNMLIIVVKPMGNVPMNIDCTGWTIMAPKISGYSVYRKKLMIHPVMKRRTLIANMTTEIQYSHGTL